MKLPEFEWDPEKAAPNFAKHDVSFADVVGVFEDEFGLTIHDPDSMDEERWITVGMEFAGKNPCSGLHIKN